MKFSCGTKDILQAVGIVSRAIGGQQALPILGNILFHVEGKHCTLSATNLEFSIISKIDANVENEGSITIPAKAIANFTQYSTDETLLFESVEESQLRCSSEKTKTIIAGEAATDYPTITPIENEASLTLTIEALLQAIYHVSFASAKTTTRPVLSGIYVKTAKDTLTLVATDSYRLSEFKIPIQKREGDIECIIPTKVLSEVLSILGTVKKEEGGKEKGAKPSEKADSITITFSSQQVQVDLGRTTVLSRLIDGSFPKYEQIIPTSASSTVSLPLHELIAHIKRMHYFAKESNNNLTFTIGKGQVRIQTQPTQYGRDESTVMVEIEGTDNKIALSSAYLLDFLSHVSGESVTMEITDKMHPALFKLPSLPDYLHLIMPLRLTEEE